MTYRYFPRINRVAVCTKRLSNQCYFVAHRQSVDEADGNAIIKVRATETGHADALVQIFDTMPSGIRGGRERRHMRCAVYQIRKEAPIISKIITIQGLGEPERIR